MQERERRRSNASTISGKRRVKSIRDGYAEAIVLDLVQPLAAGGQCCGFCRKARRDEPGREGTLQHVGTNKVVRRLLQPKLGRRRYSMGHDARPVPPGGVQAKSRPVAPTDGAGAPTPLTKKMATLASNSSAAAGVCRHQL
jgi:hypothetical protein